MKKRSILSRVVDAPYVFWALLFIVAPMLFVVYFAFTDRSGAFTFENITSLSSYSGTFVMSIGFSLIATVLCLLIGYPLAYCMAKASKRPIRIQFVIIRPT